MGSSATEELWDQPEHFRRTDKNHLGLERGERRGAEELMVSQPFSWGYNQDTVPCLGCWLPSFSL